MNDFVCKYSRAYACAETTKMGATTTATTPRQPGDDLVFKAASRVDLIADIEQCLELSANCSKGPNGPISNWDVSAVVDMQFLFCGDLGNENLYVSGAQRFNGNISKWSVSGVTNMRSMFREAKAFNGNLSDWDVSRVTDMRSMFLKAHAFNGNISKWDVGNVTDMHSMFRKASAFNGNISNWDVANVTDMRSMFYDAVVFDIDISKWNVSRVTKMGAMFLGAKSFSQTLCGAWVVSEADKNDIFKNSNGKMCSSAFPFMNTFAHSHTRMYVLRVYVHIT